jgi:hypothetical protein
MSQLGTIVRRNDLFGSIQFRPCGAFVYALNALILRHYPQSLALTVQ